VASTPEQASPQPEPTAAEPAPVTPEPTPTAEAEAISSVWAANLLSTPSKEEADAAWARIKAQDPDSLVYRYETEVDGTNQHRLRLGFFTDRTAAEVAAVELAKKSSLGTPWLVRPTISEVLKYDLPKLSNLWAVNISSTPNQAESDSIWTALNQGQALDVLNALKAQSGSEPSGVRLYRSEATVDGKTQYRVRLGFFDSSAKAEAAGRDLAQAASLGQSRIGQPWAVRPNQNEVEASQK
jgi:hypothetical protein